MNDYPNIFDYATKEFTQDAMICWLLNCKETCLPFLNKFIFKDNDEIKGEIEFEYGPSKQISRIDVYANIEYNGRYYPIIFENKANTTTHNEQIERYCNLVNDWFKNEPKLEKILLVYFKTGYMFDKEKKQVKEEFDKIENKEKFCTEPIFISAEDMREFISPYKDKYKLLEDYHGYLKNLIEKQKNHYNNWYELDSLSTHIGQGRFFQEVFGDKTGWSEGNSGSVEYSYKNLITYTDGAKKTDDNKNVYFGILYRFEPRWKRKDKKGEKSEFVPIPYLQLQLYRDNKICDKNNVWYENVWKFAKKAIEGNEEWKIDFKTARAPKNNNYNGAEIFRITFSDDENEQTHAKKVSEWLKECSVKLQEVFSSEEALQRLFYDNAIMDVVAERSEEEEKK